MKASWFFIASVLAVALFVFYPFAAWAAFDPTNPGGSGYVLTFDDEFDSISSIDVNATGNPGYRWYVTKWLGYKNTPANNINVSGGILTLNGFTDASQSSWLIATAAPSNNAQKYVGQVFGGGFYVEARIAFDNTLVDRANGHPAFWAESLQHVLNNRQWPGQATGYAHFIEDDFFEYDTVAGWGANSYGGAMVDWYGIYNVTCPPAYCKIINDNFPVLLGATTWTNFHTIGQLYIPGNSANGFHGSTTAYFDGVALTSDIVTWTDQGDGAPPPSGTFTFSILDRQSVVIILATGIGQPMQVDWVHVWQQ